MAANAIHFTEIPRAGIGYAVIFGFSILFTKSALGHVAEPELRARMPTRVFDETSLARAEGSILRVHAADGKLRRLGRQNFESPWLCRRTCLVSPTPAAKA